MTVTGCYLITAINLAELLFPGYSAIAQEQQAPAESADASVPAPDSAAPEQAQGASFEELRATLDSLENKRLQIQKEEADLKNQRAQLETLKLEIEEKIENLTKIQKELETALAQKEAKETEAERKQREAEIAKTKQLVKVYTSMKPKTAAALIDKLDMEVSLKLFELMKGEQIGNILSYVDRDRATQLSERLATRAVKR